MVLCNDFFGFQIPCTTKYIVLQKTNKQTNKQKQNKTKQNKKKQTKPNQNKTKNKQTNKPLYLLSFLPGSGGAAGTFIDDGAGGAAGIDAKNIKHISVIFKVFKLNVIL